MKNETDSFAVLKAATDIVVAELDMRRCLGPGGISLTIGGAKGETLEKAWKFLGEVFAAEELE